MRADARSRAIFAPHAFAEKRNEQSHPKFRNTEAHPIQLGLEPVETRTPWVALSWSGQDFKINNLYGDGFLLSGGRWGDGDGKPIG